METSGFIHVDIRYLLSYVSLPLYALYVINRETFNDAMITTQLCYFCR